ncbi:MAG: strawberry notch family protein [Bacteroides sp.]|nr:strawberry notch family protein [Bacteroides sp.]
MAFHRSLKKFVQKYGTSTFCHPAIVAMLDDEGLFRRIVDHPYKEVVKIMVANGFMPEIRHKGDWSKDSVREIVGRIKPFYTGSASIEYVVESMGYALGKITDVNSFNPSVVTPEISQHVDLNAQAVPYMAHNDAGSIGTLIPSSMAQPVHKWLNQIAQESGSVIDFVLQEMQETSAEELKKKLSSEQIDGLALAIYQMRDNRGFILGDMTGIGKGRQLAMLIKWSLLQGVKPVFVTEKADLFSDLYRDLFDVGYSDIRPFILNSGKEAVITDRAGYVMYSLPDQDDIDEFQRTKLIPPGYDVLLLTYSQLSREASANWKNECVLNCIKDSYLIMDESHNASGLDSNIGKFFREAVEHCAGVCFSSATYAKYPSSMPIYALKTAMGEARIPSDQLIDIISKGGPILQEVMAKGLVSSGSMIRRQRDMSDVNRTLYMSDDVAQINWVKSKYDLLVSLISDIFDFQKRYITPYIKSLILNDTPSKILASHFKIPGSAKIESKLEYMNFAQRMTPTIRQLLFAIKAVDAVNVTIEQLKLEKKPIVQISRTMASNLARLAKPGETLPQADFALNLLPCIDSLFDYKVAGNSTTGKGKTKVVKHYSMECTLTFDDLKSYMTPQDYLEVEQAYDFLTNKIKSISTGLSLSPIDYFVQSLEDAGYKVAELTQRPNLLKYTDIKNGASSECKCYTRPKISKRKVAQEFNDGKIDVLIGNRVMASGISLHSSPTFNDRRKRVVITWEQQERADLQTQFDGRADRTGQISHSDYITLTSPVPAERRFIMMHERKLRSLNANVEANQNAIATDIDILNAQGAKVVTEYIKENPDRSIYFTELAMFDYVFYKSGSGKKPWNELTNSTKVRYVADFMRTLSMLTCDDQKEILDDVFLRYSEWIKYLDEMGENTNKVTIAPLNASLLKRSVFKPGKKNSQSIFGQDACLDEIEVDVLRQPMKRAEIIEYVSALKTEAELAPLVEEEKDRKKQNIRDFYAELREKARIQLDEVRKAVPGTYKPARIAQLEEAADNAQKMDVQLSKADQTARHLLNLLGMFIPLEPVCIPMCLKEGVSIEDPRLLNMVSVGLFLGFKQSGKRAIPSCLKAVFAVNDSRCRIEIPLSTPEILLEILIQTQKGACSTLLSKVSIDSWDSVRKRETRERAYVITGNILLGIAESKSIVKRLESSKCRKIIAGMYSGHMLTYTDDRGNVRNGYMLSRSFNPKLLGILSKP